MYEKHTQRLKVTYPLNTEKIQMLYKFFNQQFQYLLIHKK